MGHDADSTALAGDTSIYLNIKKEVHWDRAVQRPYVTAITIVFPDRKEFVPPGYCGVRHFINTKEKLDSTSEPANLIYVIKSTKRIHLCFKRPRDGNPTTDIVPHPIMKLHQRGTLLLNAHHVISLRMLIHRQMVQLFSLR